MRSCARKKNLVYLNINAVPDKLAKGRGAHRVGTGHRFLHEQRQTLREVFNLMWRQESEGNLSAAMWS
jgi:hypothetical protein